MVSPTTQGVCKPDALRQQVCARLLLNCSRAAWKPALIFAAVFLCAFEARAQPAPPPPVRFTVFAAKPIAGLTFTPRANAEPQQLPFYPTARSARAEYRGAMPLRFTDSASGAVVAEATIPAGMRDVLLLFTPLAAAPAAGGTGLRYQVAVLDDSAARHAAGGLAIINLSGLALSGTVNEENVTLQPGLNSHARRGPQRRDCAADAVQGPLLSVVCHDDDAQGRRARPADFVSAVLRRLARSAVASARRSAAGHGAGEEGEVTPAIAATACRQAATTEYSRSGTLAWVTFTLLPNLQCP